MDHLSVDEIVSRHAFGEQAFRLPESCLRTPQLAQNPLGIAKVGIGARSKVENPVRVVGVSQVLRDLDAQLREIDCPAWIFKGRIQTLPEEELAETPGLEGLIVRHETELLVKGKISEPREKLRCLTSLPHRHPFIPMPHFLLEPEDLLILLVALGASLQEMGDDLGDELLMTEITGEQLCQNFNG